ncbi:carbohydrate porin [Burkholderia stagnalis]|uniref:Carbohydrate porin n=1 Tax=Burkholderia stagnalis TaxID=1503054 RepID=A0ABX9YPH5_9BURK|nr:carbohydrate porin [Burkholderia stagnalis]RQQ56872.1 carbohydrate porin [Burkholderia stagnalis]RQQ65425.1 carbohydrate porin [Burkholderia stagnalis]RQQ67145.1 carbohydrate porin [Burkholderia stagnalis]RQQ78078.1 carbohydrate porin [Burkholderia stagnalis]RQQ96349.1 carbohydrate porin [Burkholderia stagnalis]
MPLASPHSATPRATARKLRRLSAAAVACATLLGAGAAVAQDAPAADPAAPAADSLWTRDTLLGDIGGIRPWLGKYGVTFGLTESSELLANLRGGLDRGVAYHGLTTMTLGVDTDKAFGRKGGSFNASALQIHGRQFSPNYLGTLNTASGIEAESTTRLWELWYQQSLLDERVDVRVGQQAIDQEFMTSAYSAAFINTMFGWPALPSYDLPSGGPAYPLSALGVRVRAKLTPSLTALAGVYDGDPLGNNPNNRSGTNFNLHDGALFIGELQYAINQEGSTGGTKTPGGLPGTYKLGVWYHSGSFADQRDDTTGLSLANPDSNGVGRPHRGDYSVYAVADQMVWRAGPDSPRSLGVFARVMAAPGDRNLVSAAANVGVVLKAPFAGRDNDSAGLALTYIKVGRHVRALDEDARAFGGGGPYGVRGSETALEAMYNYQVAPWWQIQADAQYTFNAGAGQNPSDPRVPLRNTFVLGLRTNVTF